MESRADGAARRRSSAAGLGGETPRARSRCVDRSRRLLRGLLRQVPGARRVAQPGRGPALRLQRAGADGRRRRSSRRSGRRSSASCRPCCPSSPAGNTVRRRRRRRDDPRTAVVWCECLATSDLPGGVVNVLTGQASEMAPHLAKHREVAAMDVWSADADLRAAVEREGSGNVKRVRTHDASAAECDDRRRRAGARLHRALPRDEDRLASRRRLSAPPNVGVLPARRRTRPPARVLSARPRPPRPA